MIVFQPKGKEHIKYIKKIAHDMWVDNNFQIYYVKCLAKVLQRHREYVALGEEVIPLNVAPTSQIDQYTTWRLGDDFEWVPIKVRN